MDHRAELLAVLLLFTCVRSSEASVRITHDQGGSIGDYIDRYEKLRASNQSVMIDGLCASACTIVLATITPEKICVTPRAKLAFHAAWDFDRTGRTFTHRSATRMLYSMYHDAIQRWLDKQGGLRPRAVFLEGRPLMDMYRACDRSASTSPTPH